MKIRNLFLLVMPMLLWSSCSSMKTIQGAEPDYLDFICGKWTEVAVLRSMDGQPLTAAKATWECGYDADQGVYLVHGMVLVPEEESFEFTQEYTRTGEKKAIFEYEDSLGNTNTGELIQTCGTEVKQTGYHDDGALFMTSVSTFSNDAMNTVSHFFNHSGQEYMMAVTTATRDPDKSPSSR